MRGRDPPIPSGVAPRSLFVSGVGIASDDREFAPEERAQERQGAVELLVGQGPPIRNPRARTARTATFASLFATRIRALPPIQAATRHARATGGRALALGAQHVVVTAADAEWLEGFGSAFAYLHEVHGRVVTIPVNQ
jgi:hypothetical protein